jgi:hypothetical protein
MFLSARDYLHRIAHALEHVIAPEVDSDFLRGQLLAAVFLLDQLTDRVDYKADLIEQEIEGACRTVRQVVEALGEGAGGVPDRLRAFLREIETGGCARDLAFRSRCDEMLCSAVDAFFAGRDKLDPASARDTEGVILEHLARVASRDLGMVKPSTSQKLLTFRKQT